MRQLKDLLQIRISIGKSIFTVLGLLLISIMSFAGCGGDSGSINTASEDSSSSIGTEESSSSSVTVTKESSSSGISSIGESSSSSGVKQIPTSSSSSISSSSVFVSDGTCDSLITPFTRTYSSYWMASTLPGTLTVMDEQGRHGSSEVTIEVRKDSTFFTYTGDHNSYTYKFQNVSCELTDGELWIYSEEVFDKDINKDVKKYTLISDTNGVWDMFALEEEQYWVMGDSPYIDSSYWEQD